MNVLLHPVNSLIKVVDLEMAFLISKPRVYKIGGTPQEAIWDERYPHVAYNFRHREYQPATRATDTFMIGFTVMDIGNRTGDRNIFKIGKRLCTNDRKV